MYMHTPTQPSGSPVPAWFADSRVWETLCLWAIIGGMGVFLAQSLAAGV